MQTVMALEINNATFNQFAITESLEDYTLGVELLRREKAASGS